MKKHTLYKNRLFISFSGGRTSAYMTRKLIKQHKGESEIVVVFANTGLEHPATLDFVNACDKAFRWGVVWVEAEVNPEPGIGTRARVVTYETASRAGEPFRAMCAKFGIPNAARPRCTTVLKYEVLNAYLRRQVGWKDGFTTAVGIRADELDRVTERGLTNGYIYPLVDWGVKKQRILDYWKKQKFDLTIPEHYGNCITCWKKTDRKLYTIAQDNPELFKPFLDMESDFALSGSYAQATGKAQTFYRKHRSTADILRAAQDMPETNRFVDTNHVFDDILDIGAACGETCEIGADNEDM